MAILTVAVVLVGALCLLDLLLTVAVIRRLRDHTTRFAALEGSTATGPYGGMVAAGSPVPPFSATSIDGAGVSSEDTRPELIAFFSVGCSACTEQLPKLVDLLMSNYDRHAAIVVVAGADNAGSGRVVDALAPVATVVREPFDGPMATAFGVDVFPTMYLVDDGTVRANAVSVEQLVAGRSPVRQM